jgi:two-component system response regulator
MDIVYVEDDPNDADIFSRLMRKLDRPVTYTVLHTSSEALAYLTGNPQTNSLPKLLLLDLNLNGLSGIDIVQQARALDRTRFLPIVAFSTSDNAHDIRSAYEAGVNAYVVKPGSYGETGALLGKLCDFWLENNTRTNYK